MMARACALLVAAFVGCSSTQEVDPRYRPASSVLEVIAVLRRHVPDDTYRFEPAQDFTGRNVYRSTLLRLENLERAHAEALRAGHMDGIIAFAKARALERIRAYDLAAEEYRLSAEREEALRAEALRSADICDGIFEALALSVNLAAPGAGSSASHEELPEAREKAGRAPDENPAARLQGKLEPELGDELRIAAPHVALASFEERATRLEELARASEGTHHVIVVREEIERTDAERARYFVKLRDVIPDGDLRAVAELQRVALRHQESRHSARHLLDLADLYADLSLEYVEHHPPEGLTFDPVEFRDLVDSGARIYQMVAARDGAPEKLEAARRLEAFLAFSLGVDRDRFTP